MLGNIAIEAIEKEREALNKISLDMWNNPEVAFLERNASNWVAEYMEKQGFKVERNVSGMPTAVKATWGHGKPVIGLLGELDALPGMSQKFCSHREPVTEGAPGQGCGHNLLGVAHMGAAIGLKAELEKSGKEGTIVYYGCPAEELLVGKGFMARGGAFDELDMCIAFHPGTTNEVDLKGGLALNSAEFKFKGITAHAGGDPYNGRSALDAVELMNVGANYLREHVKSDVRIHYIITNGGMAPNIVPDKASVWYYVRAPKREDVVQVYDRLVKVAKGAAMMTETEVEIDFKGGCYESTMNPVLADELQKLMAKCPRDPWTEEEIAWAKEVNKTTGAIYENYIASQGGEDKAEQIHDHVYELTSVGHFGSTDVGDVEHICPGISLTTACYPICAPGHSWQITASTGSTIGEKGMIFAARVMALLGLEVIERPEILERARVEFDKMMGGKKYICPIPADLPVPHADEF